MVDEKDLKPAVTGQPANEIPSDPGDQPPTKAEGQSAEDLERKYQEAIARAEKAERDRDNYRAGMLAAKAKKFSLEDDEPKPAPQPAPQPVPEPQGDEDGWREVERRAKLAAEQEYEARIRSDSKQSEQIAVKKFLSAHPELVENDALLSGVKEEYVNKHGKSVDGIILDLERAYKFYQVEHNLLPTTAKATEANRTLATMPTGANTAAPITGLTEKESKLFQEYSGKFGYTLDQFQSFKKAVIEGRMTVPDEVLQIFTS